MVSILSMVFVGFSNPRSDFVGGGAASGDEFGTARVFERPEWQVAVS